MRLTSLCGYNSRPLSTLYEDNGQTGAIGYDVKDTNVVVGLRYGDPEKENSLELRQLKKNVWSTPNDIRGSPTRHRTALNSGDTTAS